MTGGDRDGLGGDSAELDSFDELLRDAAHTSTVSPTTLGPGSVLAGRYRLVRRLGEGGFGVVYEAVDGERSEKVALKVLRRLDPDALYRFKKEFRLLADVSSRHLVSLHELFAEGDQWFLTMELIEGEDFLSHVGGRAAGSEASTTSDGIGQARTIGDRKAPRSGLDEGRLRWALGELAAGVEALHQRGLLHRDLKPQNVLVSGEGRVVLLDFGLLAEKDVRRSTADQIVGTVAYMSPEQALGGDELGEASDWYAVGAMLYEALTGRLPHEGKAMQVLVAKREVDPPSPLEVSPGLPADLSALALRLLARDPRDRACGREISSVLGRREPPERAPSLTSADRPLEEVFVGREDELRALREAFDEVRPGRPVLTHVRGLSGMGKSALLERFLSMISGTTDAVVLQGRCYEQESVPFKAFDGVVDALCRFLRSRDPVTAASLMPRNVKALSRLFPVLERVPAAAGAPVIETDLTDAQELRRRGFAALAELLARVADRRPIVIAVDDGQWGDADSAVLIGDLFHGADPPGLLLLVSSRSEEQHRSPFLVELREQTALGVEIRDVKVEPLPTGSAIELARLLVGDEARAQAIARDSGGSPIFLGALARYTARKLPASEGDEVTVERVVRALVGDLDPGARQMLEVVAVAGQRLEVDVATGASGLGAESHAALTTLRRGGLIRTCAGEVGLVECYHDRIRETVVADLPPERWRGWHLELAEALETIDGVDPERLAMHLVSASEPERACAHAISGAHRAVEQMAFGQAARLFRLALEQGRVESDRERELRLGLADALANAGRGAEAAPEYLIASERLDGAERLELRRRAIEQYLTSGRLAEGLEVAARILPEVGLRVPATHRDLIATVLARRARLRLRWLRFRERPEQEVPAEELTKIDMAWTMAKGLAMVDIMRSDAFASQGLLLSLSSGEPRRVGRALLLCAIYVSHTVGVAGRGRVDRMLVLGERLARRLDDEYLRGWVQGSRMMIAYGRGQWRECRDCADRAVSVWTALGPRVAWEVSSSQVTALAALLSSGEWREAFGRLPALMKEARDRGDLYAETWYRIRATSFSLLSRGDPTQARAVLDDAMERWPTRRFDLQRFYWLYGMVHFALYSGTPEETWRILESEWPELKRSHFLLMKVFDCKARLLRADTALGLAAKQAAGAELRRQSLGTAVRDARRIGRLGLAWSAPVAQRIVATTLHLRGRTEEALTLLAEAESTLDATDLRLHAAAVRRQRGSLIGGDEGRELIAAADQVMAREGIAKPDRVARMLAPGFDAD